MDTSITTARLTELSLSAQTAYAQLLDAAVASDHSRSVADLSGSFAAKTVKGKKYWYYQYTEPSGKLRQVFVGPDNEAVKALRERKQTAAASASLGALARAAAALGCTQILPRHARVLQRLAEYGFFRAGGVLVGTHAFLAFGNMLGVRWADAERTQDVDFAHAGKSVSLALPSNLEIDTHEAIESLGMGLLPIRQLTSAAGATYLNPREPDFRLDFLTTLHRERERPFAHPRLGVTLQPVPFMEYSLEDIQQAALISGDTSVLVNVPSPARFALHKLIVFGERKGAYATKSSKDLRQAALLLRRLKEVRKSLVDAAWRDLLGRGRGWRTRAKEGVLALDRQFPDLGARQWLKLGS
jgi:hypothetical protein